MTVTPEDIARARAAHPLAFRAPLPVRLRRVALWTGFTLLFAWCLYDFDVSPLRIWEGLGRLGTVLSFMFPPHIWTTWREFSDILNGLAETLSMAFLGTLLGALVAFPLSFLGAKNINRLPLLRFGVRRGFDIIRAFETLILALIFIRALLLGTERSLFLLRRPLASCAGPLWIRHVHHPRSGNCRIGESLTFPARDGARCVCVRRSWVFWFWRSSEPWASGG